MFFLSIFGIYSHFIFDIYIYKITKKITLFYLSLSILKILKIREPAKRFSEPLGVPGETGFGVCGARGRN